MQTGSGVSILYSRKELIGIRNTLTRKPRLPDCLFNTFKSLQILKPLRGKGWKKRRKGESRIAKQPHSTPGLSSSQRSTTSRPLSKQKQLSSALINSRSLCNKSLDLNDLIIRKDLDLLFITETWLKGNGKDNTVLAELIPPAYDIVHKPRVTGRGGGIAVVYRNHLAIKLCTSPSYDSFEHILIKFISVSVIYHVVLIYRSPSSSTTIFLKSWKSSYRR